MKLFGSKNNTKLIQNIISSILKDLEIKKLAYFKASNFFESQFSPFKTKKHTKIIWDKEKHSLQEFILSMNYKEKFEFIFADIPWSIKGLSERSMSLKISQQISKKGIACFLMPSYLNTLKNISSKSYLDEIDKLGLRVLAVVQLPKEFLYPHTGVSPILIFVSHKNGVTETFFTKYENNGFHELQTKMTSFGIMQIINSSLREEISKNMSAHDYVLMKQDENLYDGIESTIDNFHGFEYWEQQKEIANLDSEYGGYRLVSLSEISKINTTKDVFKDLKNSIYIPAIGLTNVLSKMPTKNSKKKPQNYFQVVINASEVKKEYLCNFFNSQLGQKMLEAEFSKYSGAIIARLRLKDIQSLPVPVPNLGIQDEIIENISKLNKVMELLENIQESLSTKPVSSSEQLEKLDQIYQSSLDLSESEIVFNEIKKGESLQREFKSTYAMDLKTKKREDYIVFECIKTIAGMLNASGGSLFIGVADNTDIIGLESEIGSKKIFKSMDKYLNSIKDTIKSKMGASSLKDINFKPIKIRGMQILVIECNPSEHQVFIDNKHTYLRVGPATELLEGPDLVTFSKERFR